MYNKIRTGIDKDFLSPLVDQHLVDHASLHKEFTGTTLLAVVQFAEWEPCVFRV